MNSFKIKSIGLIIIALFFVCQVFSLTRADDQKDLSTLADGFALAMSKKDKGWMNTNFTSECMTYMPTGESVSKQLTIEAFTGTVYDIQKSTATNKSFMVTEQQAGGSADFTVEGSASGGADISGTYKLSFKFKRTESGWKISEILIHG